jgi:isopenicillin N synthase-like dioxygenase
MLHATNLDPRGLLQNPATYRPCQSWTVPAVPTVDIAALLEASPQRSAEQVVQEIGRAGAEHGFLQVVGHGVNPALRRDLLQTAAQFFALDEREKERIAMRHGGRAWRGWFGVGEELTAGVPDDKEGLYFGTELGPDHPAVRAGVPLHGPNLFPERPAEFGPLVLEWMEQLTRVGQVLLSAIARSMGLPADWFDRWCAEPTVLFRIFHYPPPAPEFTGSWGVAEHTDYGLLTLLVQDDTGGLEVRSGGRWVEVPPTGDAIVCNLGDMLERASGGRFRSTPHRVQLPRTDRYSLPLFLDPAWNARVTPLPGVTLPPDGDDPAGRWDGESVFDGDHTYGEYLSRKVSRVFPELYREIVGPTG